MPRVGLLSDSHGQVHRTSAAVRLLVDHGADLLIHLGDIGGPAVIDALVVSPSSESAQAPPLTSAQSHVPASENTILETHLVFGNTDWDIRGDTRYSIALGLNVDHPAGRLVFGEQELAFTHGHGHRLMRRAIDCRVTWLCHGHTHQKADGRQGGTRVINPGALQRAVTYTVALLDTDTDQLTFHTIAR